MIWCKFMHKILNIDDVSSKIIFEATNMWEEVYRNKDVYDQLLPNMTIHSYIFNVLGKYTSSCNKYNIYNYPTLLTSFKLFCPPPATKLLTSSSAPFLPASAPSVAPAWSLVLASLLASLVLFLKMWPQLSTHNGVKNDAPSSFVSRTPFYTIQKHNHPLTQTEQN